MANQRTSNFKKNNPAGIYLCKDNNETQAKCVKSVQSLQ